MGSKALAWTRVYLLDVRRIFFGERTTDVTNACTGVGISPIKDTFVNEMKLLRTLDLRYY
jgi:hypothetical protein